MPNLRLEDQDLVNELEGEIRDRCRQIIATLDARLPADLKICRIKDRNNDIAELLEDFLPV
jgi:hypothetical protein